MKNRALHSINSILKPVTTEQSGIILFDSGSDIGVRRNQGRNGARFAPDAILSCFGKLNNHLKHKQISHLKVASQNEERLNFEQAQITEAKLIQNLLKGDSTIIQLGGGHDHIFPLLYALKSFERDIVVINIDAHHDTRRDQLKHSGTPFRDFDQVASQGFGLLQLGIHDYANSKETMSPLEHGFQKSFSVQELEKKPLTDILKLFKQELPFQVTKQTIVILSLDCDALSSGIMPGVSAVNHNGISQQLLMSVLETVLTEFPQTHLGIYEYNPVYDDLSQRGARLLAALIYRFLEIKKPI